MSCVKNPSINLSTEVCSCRPCHAEKINIEERNRMIEEICKQAKPKSEVEQKPDSPRLILGDSDCSCNMCGTCLEKEALPQPGDEVIQELYRKVKLVKGSWLCVGCFQKPECYIDFVYYNYRKDTSLVEFFPDINIVTDPEEAKKFIK